MNIDVYKMLQDFQGTHVAERQILIFISKLLVVDRALYARTFVFNFDQKNPKKTNKQKTNKQQTKKKK